MHREIENHINELKASDFEIILKICEMYKIQPELFFSEGRKTDPVNARKMASYYFYHVRKYTKSKIAEIVSVPKKDHTTIINAINKFTNHLLTEPYTADLYSSLLMPRHEFTSLKFKPK